MVQQLCHISAKKPRQLNKPKQFACGTHPPHTNKFLTEKGAKLSENLVDNRQSNFLKRITSMVSILAAINVLVLTGMVFVAVFFRYFLSDPLLGVEDTMSYALALLVFSAYPYVTEERKHVQVDLFVGLVRKFPAADRIRLILIDIFVMVMLGFIALRLWEQADKFITRNSTTSGMHWPWWPLAAACAFFAFLSVLMLALRIIGEIRTTGWGHEVK